MRGQPPSLTIVRRIRATPAKLFEAWIRPEALVRWWGPDAGPVLLAETDPRIGGWFRIVFQTLDGERHDCRGEYLDIERDRKLVFSWEWKTMPERRSLVTVMLAPVPEGTELTFTHAQFADETARDGHLVGWNGAFDKLERLLATSGGTDDDAKP